MAGVSCFPRSSISIYVRTSDIHRILGCCRTCWSRTSQTTCLALSPPLTRRVSSLPLWSSTRLHARVTYFSNYASVIPKKLCEHFSAECGASPAVMGSRRECAGDGFFFFLRWPTRKWSRQLFLCRCATWKRSSLLLSESSTHFLTLVFLLNAGM